LSIIIFIINEIYRAQNSLLLLLMKFIGITGSAYLVFCFSWNYSGC